MYEGANMDIFNNLSKTIKYIEGHLKDEIDIQEMCNINLCSQYHLRRMFSYITGETISGYIRKRRLSVAALELSNTDISIADIAVKYGYESRISFARAFKELHNISPSEARKEGSVLKMYPMLVFQINLKGAMDMKYRFETTTDFKLFGISRKIMPNENKHVVLPQFAQEVMENGMHDKVNALLNRPSGNLLHGIHYYMDDDDSYYMFGWELNDDISVTDDMNIISVHSGRWVVFEGDITFENQTEFHDTWRAIYSDWFPTSTYEQENNPCIEKFTDKSFEIWIPIKEK